MLRETEKPNVCIAIWGYGRQRLVYTPSVLFVVRTILTRAPGFLFGTEAVVRKLSTPLLTVFGDETLQVSQCWISVWFLVEFLSHCRFMRLRKLVRRDHELYHVCLSDRPSARMEQAAASGRIFMKFDIRIFSGICGENLTIMTGTLREDLCTVMKICP